MNPILELPQPLADFLCVDVVWWGRDNSGFALFGRQHLIALALCAVAISLAIVAYVRKPAGCEKSSPRRRMMIGVACVALCCLALTNVLCAVEGVYNPGKVPLYSCNICEFLDLADAIHPRRWLDETCLAMGVFGGVCALIFCGWSGCPIWSVSSVTGFLEHSCIVTFPLMRVAGGDFVPKARDVWAPMLVTLANVALVIPYNMHFGTNFMFVPEPHGVVPLQGAHDFLGNPIYTLLVLVTMFLAYVLVNGLACSASKRIRRGNAT